MKRLAALLLLLSVSLLAEEDDRWIDRQQVSFLSLEGESIELTSVYNIWDRILTVSTDSNSRLCFDDVAGDVQFRLVDSQFLEMRFRAKCGTGCTWSRYYLICVKEGRLQCAYAGDALRSMLEPAWDCMDTLSPRYEDTYSLEFMYTLTHLDGPGLLVDMHELLISECAPYKNIDRRDTLWLSFSQEFGVFYSRIDTVTAYLGAWHADVTSPGHFREGIVCPVSEVFEFREYVFVDGAWCFRGRPQVDSVAQYWCGDGRDCYYDH